MLNITKNKKGDMTLNIIIGAIILVLVMVVLIAIFTGKMGEIFGQKCPGKWVDSSECGNKGVYNPTCIMPGMYADGKDHPGQVCCKAISTC